MMTYDPNAAADSSNGIFGLPFTAEESSLVYLPVPWEATTSYGGGTANGPSAILDASGQIDLFDWDVVDPWKAGMHCLPISPEVESWNEKATALAAPIKAAAGSTGSNAELKKNLAEVNQLSDQVNQWVRNQTKLQYQAGKIVALIGGDHSTPFGIYQAAAEKFRDFGILHLDAHSDTRNAYMGFQHSHASIMHNAITKIPGIQQLTQVGIRDFCDEEFQFIHANPKKIKTFFGPELADQKIHGIPFGKTADAIIATLPKNVWISVDIDGLDRAFCPNTGTPVPGGLEYSEAIYLFTQLARSGRKIIGFDLVEVAPAENDEWDANVGMRVLYKLSALTLASQGLASFRTK